MKPGAGGAGKTGVLHAYLNRHGLHPPQIEAPPHPALGLVVVIPSHDEPQLTQTLNDLWACHPLADPSASTGEEAAAEVIIAMNRAADATAPLRQRHAAQVARARDWSDRHQRPTLRFHILDFPDLPSRHAGVGLARKLGMDEAVARLTADPSMSSSASGSVPIACLDADCRVAPDYLRALWAHFQAHPQSPACALHFEHAWEAEPDPRVRLGIVQYELHLRCVVMGLRLSGHPDAFHTVGSAMAVRADTYARQGGMNRRKGAEDFYFLAKLMPLGNFTRLTQTTVIPSARQSHRVPFGTGRAMTAWINDAAPAILTPAPESYRSLAALLSRLEGLYDPGASGLPAFLAALSPVLRAFLEVTAFSDALMQIRNNTATPATFEQRLLRWWDRFRVLKWLHFARDHGWPDLPVEEAAKRLLNWAGLEPVQARGFDGQVALLKRLRALDRA